MKQVLGIDNGLRGALAYYDGTELLITDMPVYKIKKRNHINIQELKNIILENRPAHCYLEELTPLPRVSGLSAFSMGHSQGLMLGLLSAFNIPYTLVRPSLWKKIMKCPSDKDASRRRASEVLPAFSHNWDLKKHDGRAEAALIALGGFEGRL